jgi:hypothetical protein
MPAPRSSGSIAAQKHAKAARELAANARVSFKTAARSAPSVPSASGTTNPAYHDLPGKPGDFCYDGYLGPPQLVGLVGAQTTRFTRSSGAVHVTGVSCHAPVGAG